MKKEKTKEVVVLIEPPASQQKSIDFSYLNYLFISESTVLNYLQLPPLEEVEAEPEKSAIALA